MSLILLLPLRSVYCLLLYSFGNAVQVNATLLTVSLVSLAKSQCGKVGGDEKKKQAKEYLEVGK